MRVTRWAVGVLVIGMCGGVCLAEETVSKFKTVTDMMAALGEYTEDIGTFVPGTKDPNAFEMRPVVDEADDKAVRTLRAKQAVIWAVYRAFIHTDAATVTVTATPQEFVDGESKLLVEYRQKVTVTRERAKAVLKAIIGAADLSVLTVGDTWSTSYDQIAIEEQQPGPDATFKALASP